MARPKEFDPVVALDSAMHLFWRKGYDGTSTTDLVDGLGIARASMYGAFGSKRELYLAALDRFLAVVAGPASDGVTASSESGLDAIRAFLESSVTSSPSEAPDGCFAVNATVEHGDTDPEISRRLEDNRSCIETAFYGALLRAREDGELAPGVDPRAAATMLTALNTGLKVLSRAGADQSERIRTTITAVMSSLTSSTSVEP